MKIKPERESMKLNLTRIEYSINDSIAKTSVI